MRMKRCIAQKKAGAIARRWASASSNLRRSKLFRPNQDLDACPFEHFKEHVRERLHPTIMPSELHFIAKSRIEAPAEEVFRWHARPDALERLSPPWEPVEILERAPGIRDGDRGALRVRLGPFKIRWLFEHR